MTKKTKPKSSNPFDLSEVEDVRVIIKAKGKHYSLLANKELEQQYEVKAIDVRKAVLRILLRIHDIATPALQDIDKQLLKDIEDGKNTEITG